MDEDHVDEAYYEEDAVFSDFFREQLQRTPWWLISVVIHLILIGIAMLVVVKEPAPEVSIPIQSAFVPREIKPFVEQEKKQVFKKTKPIKEDQPPIEDPVIKEAQEADHHETADNEEFEQAKGEEDAISDQPFQGKSFSDAIGLAAGMSGRFGGRFGGKENLLKAGGGGKQTEDAVQAGLDWLCRHQNADGYWDADGFTAECNKESQYPGTCDGLGKDYVDTGITGLALLAFLGAGNTSTYGKYSQTVKKALRYLKSSQDEEGCYGPRVGHFMYNHIICTWAMAEAYALSDKNPLLKQPAQRGVDFLINAQNPGLGWRYAPQCGDNDTSVTGWAVMALKAALNAGLEFPHSAFEGAQAWIDSVTDPTNYHSTGYTVKNSDCSRLQTAQNFILVPSMTAVGMISRIYMGADRTDPALINGATRIIENRPKWEETPGGKSTVDFYYWYYGTLAMFQMGGDNWTKWNEDLKTALLEHQKKGGCENGSWDPVDPWGSIGGRVYGTALNVLSLEIYYRYPKVFK